MAYQRVIPRDLFNESKLLKCLGQLALLIHDGKAPDGLKSCNTGGPFLIEQRQACGGLYVAKGLWFGLIMARPKIGALELELYTVYNSHEPYPLLWHSFPDGGVIAVLDEDGSCTEEFCDYIRGLRSVESAGA